MGIVSELERDDVEESVLPEGESAETSETTPAVDEPVADDPSPGAVLPGNNGGGGDGRTLP